MNVLLHGLASWLLLMALCALNQVAKFATSDRVLWGAIGTAALFLLHPVNAEAIAWVKYVLLACVVAIVVSSPFGVAAGPALLLDFCRRRQSSKADAVAVLRDCRELAVLSLAIPAFFFWLLVAAEAKSHESTVQKEHHTTVMMVPTMQKAPMRYAKTLIATF